MLNFLKRGIIFLCAALVLYAGAVAFLGRFPKGKPLIYRTTDYYRWPGGNTWAMMHEFDATEHYDVIIVGSSHAGRGYDPAVLAVHGFRAFTLGSNSQTPLNTYWITKELLNRNNTKLLLIDTYEAVFAQDGLESTIDMMQNQPSDIAAIGMGWSMRDLRTLNMAALRILARPSAPLFIEGTYVKDGFTSRPDSIKSEATGQLPTPDFNPRQLHFFESTVALCQERRIPVVVTSHFARSNRRGEYHRVLTHYLDSVLAGTGIPYLDFTNAPGIDDRNWFEDNNHLNATGARIFTEQLADTLEVLGYLKRR